MIVTTPRSSRVDPEAVVARSRTGCPSRSMRRRILPDGLFGSSSTKRYSRGRLKRASVVGGEAVARRARRRSPRGDDERDDALAEPLVRLADDGDLAHAGMAREDVLDLERVDVLAARDDHVVDAAVEPEVAVLVEPPDVAGAVPAVADRLRVGVGAVPVAGERLVGGQVAEDLAVLAEARQARVQRRAAGAAGLRALVGADRERVDLGRAVVVDEDRAARTPRRTARRARPSSPRPRSRASRPTSRSCSPSCGCVTRSWKSVGAR